MSKPRAGSCGEPAPVCPSDRSTQPEHTAVTTAVTSIGRAVDQALVGVGRRITACRPGLSFNGLVRMGLATNSRRLVRFSILGIAGTIAFASVANADPVGVALVESSNSASVALMDYVQAGQIIRLGPHETIVLSYMSSCLRETITGGSVIVGTDRSDVRFGSVEKVVTQSAIPEKSRSRAGRP